MLTTAKVYVYEFGIDEPVKILEGETLSDALFLEYESFPENASLYYGNAIADDKRVLFLNDDDKYKMAFATGEFSLIFTPAWVAALLVVVAIGAAFLATSMMAPPSPNGVAADSSNNSLTERENQQRLNGVVPEIMGKVRATPDLIQYPYSVYNGDDREVEYSVMCLGRGRYDIDTNEIYDDTTLLKNISGSIVDIYNANQSPNNPFDLRVYGTSDEKFDDVCWNVKKCNGINGQELKAPNVYPPGTKWSDTFIIENPSITNVIATIYAPQGVYRNDSGSIIYTNVSFNIGIAPVDVNGTILSGFNELFFPGTIEYNGTRRPRGNTRYCNLYESWWKEGTIGVPVSGSQTEIARNYGILAVVAENIDPSIPLWITRIRNNDTGDYTKRGDQVIVATNDGTRNQTWGRNFNSPTASPSGQTPQVYATKYERPTWVTIYKEALNSDGTTTGIIDTNSNQIIKILIDFRVFDTGNKLPVEYSGSARNDYLNFRDNIHYGGGFDRIAIRAVRTSEFTDNDAQYVQDINFKVAYARSPIKVEDFGNVTTVYSKTIATEGALSLKKRKLNMVATRALRCYNRDGDYITINGADNGVIVPMVNTGTASVYTGSNPPYIATNRADHIIVNCLRDPVLGNVPFTSIDFSNIYNTLNTASNHFASGSLIPSGAGANYPLSVTATSFNYTFDKEDMSAEEMVMLVCNVNHLSTYREFNMIRFLFEYPNMIPKLLFNHRNKMPDSHVRTVNNGTKENYDGVSIEWRDPASNDSIKTYKIPLDGRSINPLKLEIPGIRNERQAFRHAYRAWYSLTMRTIIDEFEALPESQILSKGMRIYSADNTRANVLDGDVVGVSGSTLILSQEADLTGLTNPYIFLQHKDGTIQSLPITQGSALNRVVYTGTLSNSLITDPSYYAQTVYQILADENKREQSFLVDERTTGEGGTFRIKATVFDTGIYVADKFTFWLQPISTRFEDRTPNKRKLVPVGSPYIVTDTTRGYCLINDSPASYLKFETSNNLVLPSSFSMMAWVKLTASGTTRDHCIFSSTNGTSFRFYIAEISGAYSIRATRASTTSETVAASLPNATTAWNHVAVTYDATNGLLTLYINGERKDSLSGVATHTNPNLYVAGNANGEGFKGRLDGVILMYDELDKNAIRSFYLFEKPMTASKNY